MLKFLRERLAALLEERAALKSTLDQVLVTPSAEARDLNDTEAAAFAEARAAVVAKDTEIAEMRQRVTDAEDDETREARAADAARELGQTGERRSPATVGNEPTTYQRGGKHSYFRDLVAASLNRSGGRAAQERLERGSREAMVDLEARALSTSDTAGGDFVPPVWMMDEYISLARAGRPLADRVRNLPLPTGTDSVNLPRLATGTAVAEQATQNTAVQNTDATTNSVEAKVTTIAGQQVVAVQLIEQSPLNMDELLLADLAADYAVKVDIYVIASNAAGKRGLLSVSGTNGITYTDASPTVGELYPKIADGLQQIYTGRLQAADTIAMSPRRWAWFLGAVDASQRPLVVPGNQGPNNSLATAAGNGSGQGIVGNIAGTDVLVDPNLPINLGAGTNEDRVIIMRAQDQILMEGTPRSEAFRETKADQLSVLLRFYNYVAFTGERYPKSISVISGTGLVTPTF